MGANTAPIPASSNRTAHCPSIVGRCVPLSKRVIEIRLAPFTSPQFQPEYFVPRVAGSFGIPSKGIPDMFPYMGTTVNQMEQKTVCLTVL
jgi:hypothetical protein